MTRATPRAHGTYVKRVKDRCDCEPCVDAGRRYERRRSKLRALGRPAFVDATPVRAHVEQLLALGMTRHQIALHAGLGEGGRTIIRNLTVGAPERGKPPGSKVRPATARAILRVQPGDLGVAVAGATVDGTGTRRRLQALMANGWTANQLAVRLGYTDPRGRPALQIARRQRVTSVTALAVARLYDQLEHTPGPSRAARTRASKAGWLIPAYWDPDTIDDLSYDPATFDDTDHPDPVVVERVCAGRREGRLRRADRDEAIRELHRRGLNDQEIARTIGISDRTVLRLRQEEALPPNHQPAVAASKRIPAAKDPHDAGPLSSQGHLRGHGTHKPPHAQPRSA